ncbi:LLM class flavin-dependent oxidoreductase [Halalkalibacter nanhaiisediminis]|uniref:Luciferase family oxidoreductase group 1 n=1 Tax=Halalkalibacter nanhaiisediminis TaxID=688079 RepID=A0A562QN49_9BACI|nr:LLM class flavin-dependent oxidoreductase [Halalkalibacter nanhaiisediminis]TWI58093.1 luciferase family oxidoreductase group 1 [Halalkalibacter nanhaiisediminis]
MKLSILDQSPISVGKTAGEALEASMKLAQTGEKLGYERYWIAEHHDFPALACPAPEVMLGYIGANTTKIRIGSGAVLLPHYKPYKVAETYNLLATLFPNRIDLGIGRAPGGSAEATIALSNNYLEQVRNMPESTKELLQFLRNDFPSDHMFSKISASPLPVTLPQPWILGTGEKSAILAAENGTAYAFGHFMSDKDGENIVKSYVEHFQPTGILQGPKTIVAVSAICAETTERAEELALSGHLWKIQSGKGEETNGIPSIEEAKQYSYNHDEKEMIKKMSSKMIIGSPKEVKHQLLDIQAHYHADEIMIVTITHSYEDRACSYELIAEAFSL